MTATLTLQKSVGSPYAVGVVSLSICGHGMLTVTACALCSINMLGVGLRCCEVIGCMDCSGARCNMHLQL